jgi:tetratricopeptide (TPR) repeat protein
MRKYILITIAIILVLFTLDYLLYSPPLLDPGSRNPLEAIHDCISFIWHYTGAVWQEGAHHETLRRRRIAMAVWHRPSFSRQAFGLPADNLPALAERFESLGLFPEAAILFAAGYDQARKEDNQVLKSIISCAALGAWDQVISITNRALADNPDFQNGYYWLGRALLEIKRPEEAIEVLQSATACAARHFLLGRALQNTGRIEVAEDEYLRAVELSPRHRATWIALARLYTAEGKSKQAARADRAAAGLMPEIPSGVQFGTDLIFQGYQKLPDRIEGDTKFPFTFFWESLPGITGTITPRLRLKSGYFQKLISLDPVVLQPFSAGEIRRTVSRADVPWHVWPIRSEVTISFIDEMGVPLRILGSCDSELPLGAVDIAPRVFSGGGESPRPARLNPDRIINLDKKTILTAGTEVRIDIERLNRCSALGFISFTVGSISLPRGTEVARVECRTVDGARHDFPIRLSMETADRWLESRAPGIARHVPASIYSSHREEQNKKFFDIHSYQTVLYFPVPAELESINLIYTYPRIGAWVIETVFLVEDDENKDTMQP